MISSDATLHHAIFTDEKKKKKKPQSVNKCQLKLTELPNSNYRTFSSETIQDTVLEKLAQIFVLYVQILIKSFCNLIIFK